MKFLGRIVCRILGIDTCYNCGSLSLMGGQWFNDAGPHGDSPKLIYICTLCKGEPYDRTEKREPAD